MIFIFKWRAHDGLVLCLSWSNETHNLVSGGDDCRYKVWDNQGALIFVSQEEDFSITSVEFCPKGLYIAVGGFNMLKLCHFTGVNHHHLPSFLAIPLIFDKIRQFY